MLLPGFGLEGQEKLRAAAALVVGCGALGCTVADGLARAGVGRVVIVDRDVVEETNLQRQVLFDERDAREGVPKVEAAARRLRGVNSGVVIEPVIADVSSRNVESLVRGMQVVVDGTDNFQTRYLVNDACVKLGVPLVYGGVVGTVGMGMVIVPEGVGEREGKENQGTRAGKPVPRTACLRCVFPEPPGAGVAPTCDTAGVLGAMVGIVGSVQVAEAIKVLLGKWDVVSRGLRQMDIWNGVWREIGLAGVDRAACICCGKREFEFLEGGRGDAGETSLCGSNAVQVMPSAAGASVDLGELRLRLAAHGAFTATEHLLRGRLERERGGIELTVFRDGRAIVKGTSDSAVARGIYAKYVGV